MLQLVDSFAEMDAGKMLVDVLLLRDTELINFDLAKGRLWKPSDTVTVRLWSSAASWRACCE